MATIATAPVTGHERGTPGYRRLGAALWCAGVATFLLVYAPQALLPTLAAEFGTSSSVSSLALAATTGTLALAVVPLAGVAERWGRTRTMTVALAASAVLGVLAPLAPTFGALVAVRALQGVTIAALPALLMAHVTREVAPRWLGGAVGMVIAGNTLGGLSGRLVAGFVGEVGGWRLALAVVGGLSLVATVAFRLLLPPPVAPDAVEPPAPVRLHLADPALRALIGIGFLNMAVFVTVYNFLSFRLLAPPFSVPGELVGLVFLGYLLGTAASTAAGRLGDRYGRRTVLWAALLVGLAGALVTLPDALPLVLLGVLGVTVGFFAAHSVASGFVGRRAALLPGASPARASALYVLGYYAGSSIGGVLGGVAFDLGGWPALVGHVVALLLAALVLALHLRRVPTVAAARDGMRRC